MRPTAQWIKAAVALLIGTWTLTAHADEHVADAPEDVTGRWVQVGIDTNQDGAFDRVEWLFVRDLQRARRASAQRPGRPEDDEVAERQPVRERLTERAPRREGLAERRFVRRRLAEKPKLREKLATVCDRLCAARAERDTLRERLADRETLRERRDKPALREKLAALRDEIGELRAERRELRERLAELDTLQDRLAARREASRDRFADREIGRRRRAGEDLRERVGERRILRGFRPERPIEDAEAEAPSPPAELHSVQGTLQETSHIRLTGEEEEYVVGQLATDDAGTPQVVLGPVSQLAAFDLEEGQELTVEGSLGTIDGQDILFARYIALNGHQVHVRLPGRGELARVQGQITGMRSESVMGHDELHVIADVLIDGSLNQVCLGPESEVRELELQEGNHVELLLRHGHLDREPIVIAEQIWHEDRQLDIDHPGHEHHHADESAREEELDEAAER